MGTTEAESVTPSPGVFFAQQADGAFVGQDAARGPWSGLHCHAGPVAGLVARAAEVEVGPGKQLTRLTLDLLRPMPMAGLRVAAECTRHTRTLAVTRVTVHDLEDALLGTATTMHLAPKEMSQVPSPKVAVPVLGAARPGPFPVDVARHDLPFFGQRVETRYARGAPGEAGPKSVWLKVPDLVAGEETSPVQRICALADCGNGIAWNARATEVGFMNTDLTLQLHRQPEGLWHASDSIAHWQDTGIGMSQSVLFDERGPVGTALQTLVLHPV